MKMTPALILLMTLLTFNASAANMGVVANEAGGEIVIADIQDREMCPAPPHYIASATSANQVVFGCWTLVDENVAIVWTVRGEKHLRVIPFEKFEWNTKQPTDKPKLKPGEYEL